MDSFYHEVGRVSLTFEFFSTKSRHLFTLGSKRRTKTSKNEAKVSLMFRKNTTFSWESKGTPRKIRPAIRVLFLGGGWHWGGTLRFS